MNVMETIEKCLIEAIKQHGLSEKDLINLEIEHKANPDFFFYGFSADFIVHQSKREIARITINSKKLED